MTLVLLGVATVSAPAAEGPPDRDKRNGEGPHKNGKPAKIRRTEKALFTAQDRDVITGYYRNRYSNLPPGLAKRDGKLPPGLQRQLQQRGTLPRGLQKRIDPFPPELTQQLPVLSPGYTRGLIGGSAVVIDRRTRAIVDVIQNVVESAVH
jgi:hypothetical protein